MTESAGRSTSENKPHQPKNFSFPKREFGTSTVVRRSFQPSWLVKHSVSYCGGTLFCVCLLDFSPPTLILLPTPMLSEVSECLAIIIMLYII